MKVRKRKKAFIKRFTFWEEDFFFFFFKASRLILFSIKTTSYLVYFSFSFFNTSIMTAFKTLFPESDQLREGLY